MFVAIDRTSKFAFVELHEKATTAVSRDFLLRLIETVPYKIHTVLTDNGIQFTTPGAGGSAVPLIKQALATGNASGRMPSNSPAPRPTSSIARPNRSIHGPTVRSRE